MIDESSVSVRGLGPPQLLSAEKPHSTREISFSSASLRSIHEPRTSAKPGTKGVQYTRQAGQGGAEDDGSEKKRNYRRVSE